MRKRKTRNGSKKKENTNLSKITDDISRIENDPYHISLSRCQQKEHVYKLNCKINPNCLYGFGEFKNGIWLKNTAFSKKQLGISPKNDIREMNTIPCGLANLGATCYINSLLQSLFYNIEFRNSIYSFNPILNNKTDEKLIQNMTIMKELQRIFINLEFSNKKYYDPKTFVSLLQVQTGEQQDVQEFNKGLITLIETTIKRMNERNLISQELKTMYTKFQGEQQYVTTCTICNTKSETPAQFCELTLQIVGCNTLNQSLAAYCQTEELTGANQYMCNKCKMKTDASRKIELNHLPDTLNIQLSRFVYDMQTNSKQKVKDAIEFPLEINFKNYKDILNVNLHLNVSNDEYVYDLVSVLNHIGASSNSGHYTADVLEMKTNTWWCFDDSKVTKIQQSVPIKVGSSNNSKSNGKQQQVKKKRKIKHSSSSTSPPSKITNKNTNLPCTVSKNAYMCIYKKRCKQQAKNNNNNNKSIIPKALKKEVIDANNALETSIMIYEKNETRLANLAEKRRENYTHSFMENQPHPVEEGEEYFWIPSHYLQQWIIGEVIETKKTKKKEDLKDKKPTMITVIDVDKKVIDIDMNDDDNDKKNTQNDALTANDALIAQIMHEDMNKKKQQPKIDPKTTRSKRQQRRHSQSSQIEDEKHSVFKKVIDYSPYLCPHSTTIEKKFSPNHISDMKRLNKSTMKKILSTIPSHIRPSLGDCISSKTFFCEQCVEDVKNCKYKIQNQFKLCIKLDHILNQKIYNESTINLESQEIDDINPYIYISKKFISIFKKALKKYERLLLEVTNYPEHIPLDDMESKNINADIICPHNSLKPGKQGKAIILTNDFETILNHILPIYRENVISFPLYHECHECMEVSKVSNDIVKQHKQLVNEQLKSNEYGKPLSKLLTRKLNHPLLVPGIPNKSLKPNTIYWILPQKWIKTWKMWIKNYDIHIPNLSECIYNTFLCVDNTHDKPFGSNFSYACKFIPQILNWLNGKSTLNYDQLNITNIEENGIEIIDACQFEGIIHFYNSFKNNNNLMEDDINNICGIKLTIDENGNRSFEPPLCETCCNEMQHAYDASIITYTNSFIYITQTDKYKDKYKKDQAETIINVTEKEDNDVSDFNSHLPSSKISRTTTRTRSALRSTLKNKGILVSSEDTVFKLKLGILEILPRSVKISDIGCIRIFHHKKLLKNGTTTLYQAQIKENDMIYFDLYGTEISNENDFILTCDNNKKETGFTGTALSCF